MLPNRNRALTFLAVVAGASLLGLAQANPALTVSGWIGLLPLLWCIARFDPRRSLGAGVLFGACLGGVSAASVASIPLVAGVCGLFAGVAALMTRRHGFSPYLVAVGWLLVEITLQPLGWGEGLLAVAHGDAGVLSTVAEVFGLAIAAFVVAYVNALLVRVADVVLRRFGSARSFGLAAGVLEMPPWTTTLPAWRLVSRPGVPRAPPA
ncbi:MAG: hypothetical protein HKN62_12015 [Phycisphaerales bacterium]|nr:hypothetical protein [Phycisphaerales bacterium]